MHADQPATLGGQGNLGDVDRYLRRADANADAVDNATDDEHGNVLGGTDDDTANHPDNRPRPRAQLAPGTMDRHAADGLEGRYMIAFLRPIVSDM